MTKGACAAIWGRGSDFHTSVYMNYPMAFIVWEINRRFLSINSFNNNPL